MNNYFSIESLYIINKISILENIDLELLYVLFKEYHGKIKEGIKTYKTKDGLSDYKLKSHDYLILYSLCQNTTSFNNKIEILLVFMYSYYKLDDFHFSTLDFKITGFFKFIEKNKSIHSLIYNLVTDTEFLKKVKQDY